MFISDPGVCLSSVPYHPLHAVRQQQDDAVVADPLGLSRADELVYDALGRVVEVPKLSLPQDQSVGAGHGEAQLEPCDQQPGQARAQRRGYGGSGHRPSALIG